VELEAETEEEEGRRRGINIDRLRGRSR